MSRLVGKVTIEKLFPKYGYFKGVIESYDAQEKLYTVRYDDDDEEEMTFEELRPYILRTEHSYLVKPHSFGGRGWRGGETAAKCAKRPRT